MRLCLAVLTVPATMTTFVRDRCPGASLKGPVRTRLLTA
jgi:hypothetical protein